MAKETEIYDYVDANRTNVIKAWKDSVGEESKTKLDSLLHALENEPVNQWHKFQFAKNLRHENDLWEIIFKAESVQWRPIGIFGPGKTFTLLTVATKRGGKYLPRNIFNTAQQLKSNVRNNTRGHRIRHDYK